jgi:hypothetical protein
MQRPPHRERLPSVTGRFAKRVRNLSLIPAVCATISLAACTGTASSHGPTERVPASTRELMVTYGPGTDGPPSAESQTFRPVSVTITDLARVRQVSGLIDGLSLAWPGEEWACPAFTGGVVNLAFRNSASGRTLAAATFDASGCPGMDLTSAGVQQIVDISLTFTDRVLQIAGIRPLTGY